MPSVCVRGSSLLVVFILFFHLRGAVHGTFGINGNVTRSASTKVWPWLTSSTGREDGGACRFAAAARADANPAVSRRLYHKCRWQPPHVRRRRRAASARIFYLTCRRFITVGSVGELYQRRSVIVTLCRQPLHQDCGRAGKAVNLFARDDKELEPQLGGTITRRTAS